MKEIKLTQNQISKVSDHKFHKLNKYNWKALWSPYTKSFYAVRHEGKGIHRKMIHMHRQVANTPNALVCDHINHDTLDNQDHNLRNVTQSQNQMNRKSAQANNKLRERGISRHGAGFQVQVRVGGKHAYCKHFKTLEDAITARNIAIQKFHGEFAGETGEAR